MFKQIEMSLFLKDRALSARLSGRGKQTLGRAPLHLHTKSPVSKIIRARRYNSSPFHFNRPVAAVFWKQRKLMGRETRRLRLLRPCLRLSSTHHTRNCDADRPHARLHSSIGIRSVGLISFRSHSIKSRWEPLRAASIGKEKVITQVVSVRRSFG